MSRIDIAGGDISHGFVRGGIVSGLCPVYGLLQLIRGAVDQKTEVFLDPAVESLDLAPALGVVRGTEDAREFFPGLIIDDLGLSPMNENERKDFLEIVEDRNLSASLIVSSQVPVKDWYQIIGDPTIADAVCDRLLHNAYKIELKGESLRKAGNLKTNPQTV